MKKKNKNWLVFPIILGIISLLIFVSEFYFSKQIDAYVLTWQNIYSNTLDQQYNRSIVFDYKLYVGTDDASGNGARVLMSTDGASFTQVNSDGFMEGANTTSINSFAEVNDILLVGTANSAGGGRIYRCTNASGCDGIADWSVASPAGVGGADQINNVVVSSIYEFNGYVYAGTYNANTGLSVLRCDPTAGCISGGMWTEVVGASGFGDANNFGASSMTSFGNKLYVGTQNATGNQVWSCSTCDGTDWTASDNNGFGYGSNVNVECLAEFNNKLYAGTRRSGGSLGQVWETTTGALGSWTQVGSDGFGKNIFTFGTMLVDGDDFYIGSGQNLNPLGTVWHTKDGATFDQINDDNFGEAAATQVWTLSKFDNYLFAGTGRSGTGYIYKTDLRPVVTSGSVTASQRLDGTGNIDISFQVNDPDQNNVRGKIEYSIDNGATWSDKITLSTADADTTATYGDPKINNSADYQIGTAAGYITTSSGANTVNVVWTSKSNLPDTSSNDIMVRITPNDLAYDGTAVTSASFSIDNVAPIISNVSVVPTKANRGTDLRITVSINGTQSENPTVTVDGNSATTNNAQAGAQSIRYSYQVQGTEQEGSAPIIATARDAAGNTSTKSTTVSLDFTAPIITAHPQGGSFSSPISITLTSNEQLGKIIYTTNGDDPKVNGTTYRGAIDVNSNTTLKFYGTDQYGNASNTKTEIYKFDFEAPKTEANPPGGVYENPQAVTLSSNKPSTIYFTTDGSQPTEDSNVYNGPILISENTTLKFFGIDGAGNTEGVHTELYIITSTSPFITLTKTYGISSISSGTSYTGSSVLKSAASLISNFNAKSKFSLILLIIVSFWIVVSLLYFVIVFFKQKRKLSKTLTYLFRKQKAFCSTISIIIALCLIAELFIGIGTKAASVSRGDFITYRIDYSNQGAKETTDLRVVDSISSSTQYIPGSIAVNGVGRSDFRDNDNTDYNETNPGAITVDLGQVNPNTSGFIQFLVQVNYDVPFGTTISNKGIGSYNPGAIFTESNIVSNTVVGPAFGGPIIKKEEKKAEPKPELKPEPIVERRVEEITKNIIDGALKIITDIQKIIANKTLQEIVRNYIAPIMSATTLLSFLAAVPFVNTILPYLAYLLQYITHPVLFFGKRKRWGIVYNSLTKQPIDLAIVRLFNKNTNKLLATRITDFQGRYLFIVDPGDYYLTVTKSYHVFPSRLTTEKAENTYAGETISVQSNNDQKQKGVISFDIPIDPQEGYLQNPINPSKVIASPIKKVGDLETLPKEVIKKADSQLIKTLKQHKFNHFVSIFGPIIGLICLIISPSILTGLLFGLNMILLLLFRKFAIKRLNSWGKTVDQSSHKALPQAVIRLFDDKYGRMLLADISKGDGRYGFLVGKDKYILTSEKSGYELPQRKLEVSGDREGVISKNLELKKVNGQY